MDLSPVDVFCQSTSACPSALKSPEPAIDHAVGTCGRIAALPFQEEPCISHSERSPVVVFCQIKRTDGTVLASNPGAATTLADGDVLLRTPGTAP
jgi:hypothetical protein